jgi:hypothetical protein
MVTPSAHEVTGLLQAWSAGDEEALQKLMPLVYEELHRAARRYMARERSGHTLQTTALINEVPDAESLFFGARFLAGVGETADALETLMRALCAGLPEGFLPRTCSRRYQIRRTPAPGRNPCRAGPSGV